MKIEKLLNYTKFLLIIIATILGLHFLINYIISFSNVYVVNFEAKNPSAYSVYVLPTAGPITKEQLNDLYKRYNNNIDDNKNITKFINFLKKTNIPVSYSTLSNFAKSKGLSQTDYRPPKIDLTIPNPSYYGNLAFLSTAYKTAIDDIDGTIRDDFIDFLYAYVFFTKKKGDLYNFLNEGYKTVLNQEGEDYFACKLPYYDLESYIQNFYNGNQKGTIQCINGFKYELGNDKEKDLEVFVNFLTKYASYPTTDRISLLKKLINNAYGLDLSEDLIKNPTLELKIEKLLKKYLAVNLPEYELRKNLDRNSFFNFLKDEKNKSFKVVKIIAKLNNGKVNDLTDEDYNRIWGEVYTIATVGTVIPGYRNLIEKKQDGKITIDLDNLLTITAGYSQSNLGSYIFSYIKRIIQTSFEDGILITKTNYLGNQIINNDNLKEWLLETKNDVLINKDLFYNYYWLAKTPAYDKWESLGEFRQTFLKFLYPLLLFVVYVGMLPLYQITLILLFVLVLGYLLMLIVFNVVQGLKQRN